MYDTSDEKDEEYEAEEKRLIKEDEERERQEKINEPNCCRRFGASIKDKFLALNASRGVIVAIVLMTCVFIVVIVFANRYNRIVSDIEAHFNDSGAAEEVGRYFCRCTVIQSLDIRMIAMGHSLAHLLAPHCSLRCAHS